MRGRTVGFVSALAIIAGLLIAAPVAQAATPAIQITKVYYNSPGSDTGSNSSLNAEWIRLTNKRSYTINLKYWTVRDKTGYTYRFLDDYRLQAGYRVWIHTGKGTDTSSHRYWGRGWYVWNNTGDTAYLRNSSGVLVDTCSWGSSSGSYTYC